MKLSTARLCLDCNEVYDAGACPACGSETFAYLSRWVPTTDQRPQPRSANSPTAETYRGLLGQSRPRNSILGSALLGAAAIGMVGWFWQRGRPKMDKPDTTEPPPAASE
jgi:predicted  nucleic acid-binding Zn-ribbon protein